MNKVEQQPDVQLFTSSFGYTILILLGIAIVRGLLGLMLQKPKIVEGEHGNKTQRFRSSWATNTE